jgi:hypothetical protein
MLGVEQATRSRHQVAFAQGAADRVSGNRQQGALEAVDRRER